MARGKTDLRRASGRGSSYYRTVVIKNDPCVFCGDPSESTDHIHPTVFGGLNSWVNFAPTCVSCNNKKSCISLLGFIMNRNGWISQSQARGIKGKRVKLDKEAIELPELWFDPLGIMIRDKDSEHVAIRV